MHPFNPQRFTDERPRKRRPNGCRTYTFEPRRLREKKEHICVPSFSPSVPGDRVRQAVVVDLEYAYCQYGRQDYSSSDSDRKALLLPEVLLPCLVESCVVVRDQTVLAFFALSANLQEAGIEEGLRGGSVLVVGLNLEFMLTLQDTKLSKLCELSLL